MMRQHKEPFQLSRSLVRRCFYPADISADHGPGPGNIRYRGNAAAAEVRIRIRAGVTGVQGIQGVHGLRRDGHPDRIGDAC